MNDVVERAAQRAASRVLPSEVWAEARRRLMADMTGADFEDHLIRVAAEHAARIALADASPDIGKEGITSDVR